ncbi:MAG: SDR family oxidoreductase [Acidobacteria bacterium]|nr:SDR family oxidoreductase [Acidobacteriota bacterium]
MRLKDDVALITGGSRGIGRAIALRFAREGANVVVAARNAASIESVEKEIRAFGREALGIICDVGDDAAVREMVRRAEAQFGRIDILVNNAGYFCSLHPIHEMTDAEWDRSLRDNLSSAFYVSRAVMPGMTARRRGSILMMSSLGAKAAYPFGTPYAAAKAGLLGLTRALAAEGGPYGIRVNALSPGVVEGTEVHDKVSRELERIVGLKPEDRLKGAREMALLRRVLSPDDIAAAALFLASSDSASITGQTLNVDAGMRFD